MARNRNDLFGFATAMAQTKATGYESRRLAAKYLDTQRDNAFKAAARNVRKNLPSGGTMDATTRKRMQEHYKRENRRASGLSVG